MNVLSQDANITINLPIGNSAITSNPVIDFMNANYILIIGFLSILSSLMIYTLLLSDINTKTFEFGMLRALGFNKQNLASTILFQACVISLPALIFGLAFGSALNASVRKIIFEISRVYTDYNLTATSVKIAVTIGLIIPLAANIIPLRKALASNLRASLDIHHRHVGEVEILIKKFEDIGLQPVQTVMALTLTSLGFLIFVGAP